MPITRENREKLLNLTAAAIVSSGLWVLIYWALRWWFI
jgi:hypothetical protein